MKNDKNDIVEFDTSKSLKEISNLLKTFKCEVTQIQKDSLEPFNGVYPKIAITMVGKATMKDAFQHFGTGKSEWGVQVFVYDMGKVRHVELIAIAESALKQALYAYGKTGGRIGSGFGRISNEYINATHSRTYRDRIADLLKDVDESTGNVSAVASPAPSAPQNNVSPSRNNASKPSVKQCSFADEADAVDIAFNSGTYPEGSMQDWMVNGAMQSWFNMIFDPENTRDSWVTQANLSLWSISFMGWKVAHYGLYEQEQFAAWKKIKETADSITRPAAEKCTKKFDASTTNPFTQETYAFDGWLLEHFERSIDDGRAIWDYCLGKNGTLYVITTHINADRSEFKYKVNEILYLSSQMFRPFSGNSFIAITNGWIEAFNTVPIVTPASRTYTIPGKNETLIYNFPIEINGAENYPYNGLNGLLIRLTALIQSGKQSEQAKSLDTFDAGNAVPFNFDDYVLFAAKSFSQRPHAQSQEDFINNPDSCALAAFRYGRFFAANGLAHVYPEFHQFLDMVLAHEKEEFDGQQFIDERQLATDIADKCGMPPITLVLLAAYAALISAPSKDESILFISNALVDRACQVNVKKGDWEEILVATALWFSNKNGFKNAVLKKFQEIKDTPEYNLYDRSKAFPGLVQCGITCARDGNAENEQEITDHLSDLFSQHRRVVASAVENKYPAFKQITDLIDKTNAEMDQSTEVFASNFGNEFNAEWEFAKDEAIKKDSDFHVLLAAMTAFVDDFAGKEQKDATHILDIILNEDDQIFGISQIYLLVSAMWYADYKNFRHYVLTKTVPEADGAQKPAQREVPQPQIKPAAPKPQPVAAKYAPAVAPPSVDIEDAEDPEFARTRQMAEAGDVEAERQLGYMYLKGDKTARDKNEGLRWLKKAGTDGDQEAQSFLINLAKKNVPDFQEKFQLVQSFGEQIMSDPRKARDDKETGSSYAQAYREIVRFLPVSTKSQLRFLLFCFKVQPEVVYSESGAVSADFLIRELDGYLDTVDPDNAKQLTRALEKIDYSKYEKGEQEAALLISDREIPSGKGNWSKVARHVEKISKGGTKAPPAPIEPPKPVSRSIQKRAPVPAPTPIEADDEPDFPIQTIEPVPGTTRPAKRTNRSAPAAQANKIEGILAKPQTVDMIHLGIIALVFLSVFSRSILCVLICVALEIAARSFICRLGYGKVITIPALEKVPLLQNVSITTIGLSGFGVDMLACIVNMSFAWALILCVIVREAAKYFAANK